MTISMILLPINDMIYRFGEEVLKPLSEKMKDDKDPFVSKEAEKPKETEDDSDDIDFKTTLGSMFFNPGIKN